MGRPSFTAVQSIVALVAGLTSIGGATYSVVSQARPAPGEVVAIVRDARGDAPVRGASVEILTTDGALVTALAPADDGRTRRVLAAGDYRLRVTHPQFAEATRDLRVLPGETAEVRVVLARRDASDPRQVASPARDRRERGTVVDGATAAVGRSVSATRRFLGRLGL